MVASRYVPCGNRWIRSHTVYYILTRFANCFEGKYVTGAICHGEYFVTGGNLFLGGYCFEGHFDFGGNYPMWFFDWEAYGLVAFVLGLFAGDL